MEQTGKRNETKATNANRNRERSRVEVTEKSSSGGGRGENSVLELPSSNLASEEIKGNGKRRMQQRRRTRRAW